MAFPLHVSNNGSRKESLPKLPPAVDGSRLEIFSNINIL